MIITQNLITVLVHYTNIAVALSYRWKNFFVNILLKDTRPLYVGLLIPLFWTSGDVCPKFQCHFGSFKCSGHHGSQAFLTHIYPQALVVLELTTRLNMPQHHSAILTLSCGKTYIYYCLPLPHCLTMQGLLIWPGEMENI